jgi:hypothetical protein
LSFESNVFYFLAMAKGIWQRAAIRLGARNGDDEDVAGVEGVLPGETATTRAAHASASATAEPGLICDEYGCMTPEEVAQQKALAESGTEAWWPGSGYERPQPNNCAATKMKADGC